MVRHSQRIALLAARWKSRPRLGVKVDEERGEVDEEMGEVVVERGGGG